MKLEYTSFITGKTIIEEVADFDTDAKFVKTSKFEDETQTFETIEELVEALKQDTAKLYGYLIKNGNSYRELQQVTEVKHLGLDITEGLGFSDCDVKIIK